MRKPYLFDDVDAGFEFTPQDWPQLEPQGTPTLYSLSKAGRKMCLPIKQVPVFIGELVKTIPSGAWPFCCSFSVKVNPKIRTDVEITFNGIQQISPPIASQPSQKLKACIVGLDHGDQFDFFCYPSGIFWAEKFEDDL